MLAVLAASSAALAETAALTFTTSDNTLQSINSSVDGLVVTTPTLTTVPRSDVGGDSSTSNNLSTLGNGYVPSGLTSSALLTPNANLQAANGFSQTPGSWTLAFTLSNTTGADIAINGITLSAFGFNGSNQAQQAARNVQFSLTFGATQFTCSGADDNGDFVLAGNGATGNEVRPAAITDFDFAANDGFTLASGESVLITLETTHPTVGQGGTFAGLSGMALTYSSVPEPATATLSLLALAGLAARRRRK